LLAGRNFGKLSKGEMNAKTQSHQTSRPRWRIRLKRDKNLGWLPGIAGLLLIIGGLGIIINRLPSFQGDWQDDVTDARLLEVDELLPLAEPINPIEGWHDMSNLPDPNQPGRNVPADQPQPNVDVPVSEYDFGAIPPGPGYVSQIFYIQNTGTEVLEISNVTTSCGCTRANLSSSVIPPGTRAELMAIFDPDFHDAKGPVKRVIWLETNDPDWPMVEVSFTANVRKE
jgi:hypothetical protein